MNNLQLHYNYDKLPLSHSPTGQATHMCTYTCFRLKTLRKFQKASTGKFFFYDNMVRRKEALFDSSMKDMREFKRGETDQILYLLSVTCLLRGNLESFCTGGVGRVFCVFIRMRQRMMMITVRIKSTQPVP